MYAFFLPKSYPTDREKYVQANDLYINHADGH